MPRPNEEWQVRTPWPDETVRLERHFKVATGTAPERRAWHQVIAASSPARIVGLAVLRETDSPAKADAPTHPELHLAWDVRPAWREHPAAAALLEAALTQARLSRARQVTTTLPADEALARLALQKGFAELSRQEVWGIPVAAALAQLEGRGGKVLAHLPVEVFSLDQAPLDQVRKICSTTNLLAPDQVRPSSPGVAGGFDPELSFGAGHPAKPDAILLGREQFGTAYLEILARNPEAMDLHFTGMLALLRAFFRAASALGLEQATCAVRSGNNVGLVPFARRAGGQRQESVAMLKLDLR